MRRRVRWLRSAAFGTTLVVGAGCWAAAQGRGPGGPPGGGGGWGHGGTLEGGGPPPGGPRGFPNHGPGEGTMNHPQEGSGSTMRGGLQLGPPGRWWDDRHFSKDLHLRPDQQRRMDTIFEDNRGALVSRFQSLQQEESRMEALSRAPSLEEPALFAQIDRVAQARAELEKVNTHYLLQIRREMDPDQISRLEEHR